SGGSSLQSLPATRKYQNAVPAANHPASFLESSRKRSSSSASEGDVGYVAVSCAARTSKLGGNVASASLARAPLASLITAYLNEGPNHTWPIITCSAFLNPSALVDLCLPPTGEKHPGREPASEVLPWLD